MSATHDRVASAANPRFRDLLALVGSARERKRQGLSVIEGTHLLERYRARFGEPQSVFLREGRGGYAGPATVLSEALFARVSQVDQGPGPIAIVATPRPSFPSRIDGDAVYLDRIQDPGNVGAILRTCAAAGIGTVVASPATAYCWSPKVLRAAMGAHFDLEIHEGVDFPGLLQRCAHRRVLATSGHDGKSLYALDLLAPAVWVFGNEGEGVDHDILAAPDVARVRIPISAAVESLNVAAALAVCLFEQRRQRSLTRGGGGRGGSSSRSPR